MLLIGFIIISRYRNKQYLQEKRIRILQQEQEIIQLRSMMEGEEKERKRIARDLHDGVSQTMSAAKINLMAIEAELGFNGITQKAKFEKIIQLVDSSFKEVRTISHNMMPNALLEAGLMLVIKQFIDNINSDVIKINLYCNGLDEHFDGNIETILYRVIQECVTNVIKHANATRLDISLNKDEDGVSVTIEDNGKGFDVNEARKQDGIGLKNIETRIHFLQGQVEFDSSPGNGTLVSIHVPLQPKDSGGIS
jgi:signal transduction histidine kinase